jgi:hypothetical protein
MNNPIIEEVRKNREKHAEGFNYNLDLIYKDFKQKEQRSGRMTVVSTSKLNLKKSA